MSYLWNVITGKIGQYVEKIVPIGGAVSLTSNVAADITSLPLPAGDWDVRGSIVTNPSNGAVSFTGGWLSTTSATVPNTPNGAAAGTLDNFALTIPVGTLRLSLSAPTTVYLSGLVVFTGSCGMYGILAARRIG
jgi:hypothetical protein